MRRVVFVFVIFSMVSVCKSAVITVDDDGPADFNNIQDAIDFAVYGDTIQVAEGTYVENITLKNGVALIGAGYANTIIDGNSIDSVVISNACDPNTLLQGFTITNGKAEVGGGMYNENNNRPIVTDCCFIGNTTIGYGGGGIYNFESSPIINNCTFICNIAYSYGSGGGINNYASNPLIAECTFSINMASRCGGGIHNENNSSPNITNCKFIDNECDWGGGMFNGESSPTVTNCIFSGNRADDRGGGIYNNYGSPIVKDSILWGNTADDGPQIYNSLSSLIITYSDIEGGWEGEGNIDADPCFANPGYWDPNGTPADANDDFWVDGDYHLQSQAGRWDANNQSWVMDSNTSPCIDAGDWMTPIGFEPFPNGGRINMGAYGGTVEASKSYFGAEPCETIIAGDINGDCIVDFVDFAIMSMHWLEDARPVD